MRLKKEIRNLLVALFCCVAFSSSTMASSHNIFEDEAYYRSGNVLKLLKSGDFTNNDLALSVYTKGTWSVKNDSLFLMPEKVTAQRNNFSVSNAGYETFSISYISDNKLTLTSAKGRFSYHDYDSTYKGSGFPLSSILRGIMGMLFLFFVAFALSRNRKAINWSLVLKGSLLQLILALFILKVPFVSSIFDWLAKAFTKVIDFSHEGAIFLFGSMGEMPPMLANFAFWILPTVVFVSALSSLMYYFGILQFVVKKMAWVMNRFLGISGSESVAAAANVFVGQTEAPLLVKPYLDRMTRSEMLCLMVGGMATIAGGVLGAVVGILGQGDPVMELFYAKHLLTASLMSAPAAIVFAKILLPETEKINKDLDVAKDKMGVNALEAITNGTTDGLKLAVNVGAMLLVFTSLIALLNYVVFKIGDWTTLNAVIESGGMYDRLSFESISGYLLSPLAWILGVEWQDAMYFGQLLGEKTIINEFIAYPHLGDIQDELSNKTIIMSTYVLCGFANIVSIGIQVGGVGILIPNKKSMLARLGLLALLGGTLACMSTSVLAGMLF
ncbi:MAG: nucleoside transporter C-terminal domain-containing protein [Crocinitomicaceae bacterium]|nr:nucleoside transporter C-terminal domain-containing protein [Crocinitomicaceae bacterium]